MFCCCQFVCDEIHSTSLSFYAQFGVILPLQHGFSFSGASWLIVKLVCLKLKSFLGTNLFYFNLFTTGILMIFFCEHKTNLLRAKTNFISFPYSRMSRDQHFFLYTQIHEQEIVSLLRIGVLHYTFTNDWVKRFLNFQSEEQMENNL